MWNSHCEKPKNIIYLNCKHSKPDKLCLSNQSTINQVLTALPCNPHHSRSFRRAFRWQTMVSIELFGCAFPSFTTSRDREGVHKHPQSTSTMSKQGWFDGCRKPSFLHEVKITVILWEWPTKYDKMVWYLGVKYSNGYLNGSIVSDEWKLESYSKFFLTKSQKFTVQLLTFRKIIVSCISGIASCQVIMSALRIIDSQVRKVVRYRFRSKCHVLSRIL